MVWLFHQRIGILVNHNYERFHLKNCCSSWSRTITISVQSVYDQDSAYRGLKVIVPFSNCSICSVENEVLFLWSFLLSLSLICESSSPDELWSELPSEVASVRPSLTKSLKLTENKVGLYRDSIGLFMGQALWWSRENINILKIGHCSEYSNILLLE